MQFKFISIEGNIGSGKTSLSEKIAKYFNAKLILEKFADNPFLPNFYKNPEQNAFPLELFLWQRDSNNFLMNLNIRIHFHLILFRAITLLSQNFLLKTI